MFLFHQKNPLEVIIRGTKMDHKSLRAANAFIKESRLLINKHGYYDRNYIIKEFIAWTNGETKSDIQYLLECAFKNNYSEGITSDYAHIIGTIFPLII